MRVRATRFAILWTGVCALAASSPVVVAAGGGAPVMLLGRTTAAAGPSDQLLAHYPFNGNADDESGNGHHGTVVGATLTTDRFGNEDSAYGFDGNDQIWVADDPEFTLGSDPFTIATWMQFSELGSYYMMGHDEGEGNRNKWIFWVHSSGFLFHVNGQFGSFNPIRYDGWLPEVGRWYHLAIVRDGNVYTQYIDGSPVQTATHSSPIPDPNTTLKFGTAEGGHPERVYRGLLDEIRIYGRPLGANEIAELAGLGFLFDEPQETPAVGEATIEATGDFNLDRFEDVIVAIPAENVVQVFLNGGLDETGGWAGFACTPTFAVGTTPSGVTVGDFDGDGLPDAAVSNVGSDDVSILLNLGRTDDPPNCDWLGFADAVPIPNVGTEPIAIASAEFDRDDGVLDLDLAVANRGDGQIVILRGQGDGSFVSIDDPIPTGEGCRTIDPADLDNDKDLDEGLVFATQGDGVEAGRIGVVFQEDGMFVAPFFLDVGVQPVDVAIADLDRNGIADITCANFADDTVSVLLNRGGGTFDPQVPIPVGDEPRSVDTADLDRDSDPDLSVVAVDPGIGQSVQVLENLAVTDGGVSFAEPLPFGVDAQPRFVVSADVNRDSLLDLVTANAEEKGGGSVSVLINNPPQERRFADYNRDGVVDFGDILLVLAQWGTCPPVDCPDCDFDGRVNFEDLLCVLADWG